MNQPLQIEIVPKGVPVEIKDKSTGASFSKLYVGAGWDQLGSTAVDLDLVGAALVNGKLTAQTRLVYFGDKTEPGITLSEDNRSGAGDGDDESIVIDLDKVEQEITEIALGVVAYSAADLATVKNVHFRIVNGQTPTEPQVFDVKMDQAQPGDTVLYAAVLKRQASGWTIENKSAFSKAGNGSAAVQGFANLFA
jgi:stress response protein SCP2